MRYLVCLFGGLLIGALIALTAASILRQRDVWPRAVMNVMQHEITQLRELVHEGRCTGPEATAAMVHLELMASDIEPALMAPGARDPVFSRYATDLRKKLTAFGSATECPARSAALTDISNACEACHRDYK